MPTESQLRDAKLRMHVRQLIEYGTLPKMLPQQIAAGYGAGHRCVACDQEITRTQIEYDVGTAGSPLRFHLGCHVLWQMECALARSSTPASAA